MGMIVNVMVPASQAKYYNGPDQLCLMNVDGPFEPNIDCPAALLVNGNLPGTAHVVLATKGEGVVNVLWKPATPYVMFGGNFVHSSDSRFARAVEATIEGTFYGAVPLHDRNV